MIDRYEDAECQVANDFSPFFIKLVAVVAVIKLPVVLQHVGFIPNEPTQDGYPHLDGVPCSHPAQSLTRRKASVKVQLSFQLRDRMHMHLNRLLT